MRKVKFVSVLVLLALLLSAGSGVTVAQEPPLEDSRLPNLPGLGYPVSEWTDDELEQLVDLIVSERITVQQSQVISEQLTEEQITKVGELLAVRAGVPLDEARQAMAERRRKEISGSCSTSKSSRGDYFWTGGGAILASMQGPVLGTQHCLTTGGTEKSVVPPTRTGFLTSQ